MKPTAESDELLLEHIGERIQRVFEYTRGERSGFDASTLVQDAVLRNLQVLAESTQRLSESLKKSEPSVPWSAIAEFRNVLRHEYPHIDFEVVWKVVDQVLPELDAAVDKVVRRVRGSG